MPEDEQELPVVQKIGAQYLAKRFADYVTAPPSQPSGSSSTTGDLDGQAITDEQGQTLGTAHLLRGVAVYVVTDGDPQETFKRCVGEPETRLLFGMAGGRLTGLIYVPDPNSIPRRAEGTRADDV